MSADRSYRYGLRLPVEYSWADLAGRLHRAIGESSDLNMHGVFVLSSERPREGPVVTILALLPALLQKSCQTHLRGIGLVTRVTRDGFAIHGQFRIEADQQPPLDQAAASVPKEVPRTNVPIEDLTPVNRCTRSEISNVTGPWRNKD